MGKMKNAYEKAPAIFSLILCFALVIGSIAVYLAVGLLPRGARIFDISPNKLYTLHTETEKLLSELDRDIEVLLVSETGIPDYSVTEMLLKSYAEENSHIKLTLVYPDELYDDYGTLTEGCAVIKSAVRETVVYSSDYYDVSDEYFDISYNYYYYLTEQGYELGSYSDFMYSGYAESMGLFDIARYQSTLTNAIRFVASDNVTTIYATCDHEEEMLDVYLYPELRLNSTELVFGKLSDGIPDNADGVLINNPVKDITEEEKTSLLEFLSKGGKLTVTTSYTNIKNLTNLRAVCEEYGLTTDGGFLCEDDKDYNYSQYAMVTIPTVSKDAFVGYLTADGLKPIVTGGTGITITEKAGITASSLLNSSVNAYTKQNAEESGSDPAFNEETDVRGQYSVAALARNTENGSSVLWFPTFTLSSSVYDTASSRNNFPVFTAALCSQYGTEKPIDIENISLTLTPIEASKTAVTVGMVLAIAVPCVIIAAGAFVVIGKRKRAE